MKKINLCFYNKILSYNINDDDDDFKLLKYIINWKKVSNKDYTDRLEFNAKTF